MISVYTGVAVGITSALRKASGNTLTARIHKLLDLSKVTKSIIY